MLREFAGEHGVAYDEVGKVIVATDEVELPRLDRLLERGRANGVPGLRLIDADELREIEPHAAGLRAIHSPHTAIVDYPGICRALLGRLRSAGVSVRFAEALRGVREVPGGLELTTAAPRSGSASARYRATHLVSCAGLHADRIARLAGAEPPVRIVPFRGEYYFLTPERRNLVRGLIYPVPDPDLPFLGVHFTRTTGGEVEAGPNAVFALAREGYRWGRVNLADLGESLTYPGFWKLAARVWRIGAYEMARSLSTAMFVNSLQKLVPSVTAADVRRGGAGVRAQAVGPDGQLLDDFAFAEGPHSLHVLNAPSPAATASLSIGAHIAERVVARLKL
jgi:L-2-hydroxyglutarate oxidase